MSSRPALEIAVQDLAGLQAAHAGGADRVEVCSALLQTGGLTPSHGMVEAFVEAALLPVHVLIRCRPGDFVYDESEIDVMRRDILHFTDVGATGVVIGALTSKGALAEGHLAALAEAAGSATVTWHRMVDVLAEPVAAVHRAAVLGATRILTSGGADTASRGEPQLAAMRDACRAGIELMAGGGIRPEDVPALVRVGVDAIHLSASRTVHGYPVGPGGGRTDRTVTDPAIVAAIAERLTR